MPKITRGWGTGASSLTPESGYASPSAGVRSPDASRSSTVPDENATISSPRTSPATGSELPAGRKVASFMRRNTRQMADFGRPRWRPQSGDGNERHHGRRRGLLGDIQVV